MPSFFEAMKRIVQGKPVYDASDTQAPENQFDQTAEPLADPLQGDEPNTPPTSQALPGPEVESTFRKDDARTFPVAYIKRTVTRVNGTDMQVYCYIQNDSNELLDLHKISLLGREEELKHPMNPGADREFLVYEGPRPASTDQHEALLIYKTETGAYFEAVHDIRFSYNNTDHLYSIDELHVQLPVRAIHA